MVNGCAKRCQTKNVFAGKRNFSLNKAKKEKKNFFCEKVGSMPTLGSTRKGKKCFFVISLRLSEHKVLHNIASSSSFLSISLGFSRFFRSCFVL